jgi:hypothetical protein
MQLRDARLCLDCEELHTEGSCPVCASEAFVFVTRWIPVEDKESRKRRPPPPAPSTTRRARWLTAATTGLALAAAARWLWRALPRPAGADRPEGSP